MSVSRKAKLLLTLSLVVSVVAALPSTVAAATLTPTQPTRSLTLTPSQPAAPMVGPQRTFDRASMRMQLKQMQNAKIARAVAVKLQLSTAMQVQMCQQQRNALASTLGQCLATNSDPVNPPLGSPLDAFNKLTNAQLAQKCPGTLQQCLDQVMDEQIAWCKANVCKSQADAVSAKDAECAKLDELLAQELAQPPALKNNTPPCPALYQSYLAARDAVKNYQCGGSGWGSLGCIGPLSKLIEEEKAALQKLKDNSCI